MSRSRVVSLVLLSAGGACIAVGMFVLLGLGVALVTVGVLLVAAEFLVPGR